MKSAFAHFFSVGLDDRGDFLDGQRGGCYK